MPEYSVLSMLLAAGANQRSIQRAKESMQSGMNRQTEKQFPERMTALGLGGWSVCWGSVVEAATWRWNTKDGEVSPRRWDELPVGGFGCNKLVDYTTPPSLLDSPSAPLSSSNFSFSIPGTCRKL